MLEFIMKNWSDLLLTLVGLSAFAVYYVEKHDRMRTAATLVISQIDEIDEQISTLKHEPQLNEIIIYNAKTILTQNIWEQYKHLFTKVLDTSEYNRVQTYYDNAERVERVRGEIVDMIETAWHDKSSVISQTIAELIGKYKDNPEKLDQEITIFKEYFRKVNTGFTADVSIQSLIVGLNNYYPLNGTTAYKKLKKYSFNK